MSDLTIIEAVRAIRHHRQTRVVVRDGVPHYYKKSTSGDYDHVVVRNIVGEFVCETCVNRNSLGKCWAAKAVAVEVA